MKTEVLNQFIEEMLKLLQDAKGFASAELPELCKEILQYGVIKNGIGLLVMAGALVAVIAASRKSHRESDRFDKGLVTIGGLFLGIFPAIGFLACGEFFIMAIVAPRLYLITYFKGLL